MKNLAGARPAQPVRVLLTGFGPFPGAPANPSAAVVATIAHMGRRRLGRYGIELSTAILPVVFAKIDEKLAEEMATTKPDAVVHLGLAGRRRALTVETRAKNRLSILHPDAAKARPTLPIVISGAPERRDVRLPTRQLAAAMNRNGALTRLSNDAGTYVCNATLYHTLGASVPIAGFIHLPWPRPANRPLSRRRNGPTRPNLAAMVAAVMAALMFIGAQARRDRRLRSETVTPSL